ncbi:MAG: hypothetical protein NXI04_22055 [Planctomycetaceae bacterium]|nr:hypothetical protein [Planctomycetaceae bacterium]
MRATDHPLYVRWKSIRQRCQDPSHSEFPRYGGRGIRLCRRWQDFWQFVADIEADIGPRPDGRTLDRIQNRRGYCRGNLRWATAREQSNNRRTNRFLRLDGIRQTVAQWARQMGMNATTLHSRLAAGWTTRDAITTPVGCH